MYLNLVKYCLIFSKIAIFHILLVSFTVAAVESPILLEADRGQFDNKSGINTYEGHVIFIYGFIQIRAEIVKIKVFNHFVHIEATGKPVILRYVSDKNTKATINCTSNKIEYDTKTNKISITGNIQLIRGQDIFSGDYMEYNVKEDLLSAQGSKNNGRIKIIINQKL